MMQAMRNKVKIVYWIVIVSFVGLMFFVWGMDAGRDGLQTNDGVVVARVNGREITQDQWTNRANSIMGQMRQQQPNNQSLNENQVLRARQQAYDQLVSETLQQMEAENLGITVTNAEIVHLLSNDPPPYLRQQFTDPNGNFDAASYHAALDNPQLPWRQIEDFMRQSIPLEKLEQRIAGRAVVGEQEIRQSFAEQTQRAVAEYITVPFSDIELDDESVTEAEARSYYDRNLHEYTRAPQAAVRLVSLTKAASDADAEEVLDILADIRADIEEGSTTFTDAARSYSEDSSAEAGGDLGFMDRERMVQEFTEAAFALSVGEMSQPVSTEFGVHLIQVTDEKVDDDGERTEVKASHILLKLHPSQDTLDQLRESFQSFHDEARTQGIDAASAAHGLEITEPAPFQEGFNIPGVANSLPGSGFAFSNQPGELSPVFETTDMFYAFEVVRRDEAGHRGLEEVRAIVDAAVVRDRRANLAAERLATTWAAIQGGEPWEAAADDDGLTYAVTDTFTYRQNIPDIGFATPFARAALDLNQGDTLSSVRTQRGIYAMRVVWKSDFNEAEYRARRAQIASSLLYSQQQKVVQEWMDELRDAAVIEDLRSEL